METVPWLDEREERAWRGLQLMQMQLTARMARDLSTESALSYPDYVVLAQLTARADHRMRAFELARELGWEQSRLSHHLARMAARDLVTKERCPSDRRGWFVVATDEGRRALAAAAPGHVATVRRYVLDRITPEQLDALGEVSTAVLAALAEGCAELDAQEARAAAKPPKAAT